MRKTMDPRREKLLNAKLGDLITWVKPEIAETVGPFDPSVWERFDTYRRGLITECAEKLEAYSEHQISIIVAKVEDDNQGVLAEWSRFYTDEIMRCLRGQPPWYAGGFGHPDQVADFEYWSRMPLFSIHELLCLSVGVEPDRFLAAEIKAYTRLHGQDLDQRWPTLRFLVRRRVQLDRQFALGASERKVSAKSFLAWADQVAFDAHPEFLRLLRKFHSNARPEGLGRPEPAPPDKREIDKIAQLFTAVAIAKYRYDPHQGRSEVPKKIADLASSMGLQISDGTVLKYLRIGASFLPEDWKPNSSDR